MKKNVKLIRKVALFRMQRLFELAEAKTKEKNVESDKLARRYTSIIAEIGRHYKISVPKKYADRICKHCGRVLVPGLNCTVRLASSKEYVVYRCSCGTEKHIFYSKRAVTSRPSSRAAR